MCKISFDQNYGISIMAVTWWDITMSTLSREKNATHTLSISLFISRICFLPVPLLEKEKWREKKRRKKTIHTIVIQIELNYILSISSRTSHSVCRFFALLNEKPWRHRKIIIIYDDSFYASRRAHDIYWDVVWRRWWAKNGQYMFFGLEMNTIWLE